MHLRAFNKLQTTQNVDDEDIRRDLELLKGQIAENGQISKSKASSMEGYRARQASIRARNDRFNALLEFIKQKGQSTETQPQDEPQDEHTGPHL